MKELDKTVNKFYKEIEETTEKLRKGKEEMNNFTPTVAIPPGETIKENLKLLNMEKTELAVKLGMTLEQLKNLIDYKSAWNELKEKTKQELEQATWSGAGLNDTKISMQELEKKYNLGGE